MVRDQCATRLGKLRLYLGVDGRQLANAGSLIRQDPRFRVFSHFGAVVGGSQQSEIYGCVGVKRQGAGSTIWKTVDEARLFFEMIDGSCEENRFAAERKILRSPRSRRYFESCDEDDESGDGD